MNLGSQSQTIENSVINGDLTVVQNYNSIQGILDCSSHFHKLEADRLALECRISEMLKVRAKAEGVVRDFFERELEREQAALLVAINNCETFKNDVFELYRRLSEIEVDSGRLALAKERFICGDLDGANQLLSHTAILDDQRTLLAAALRTQNELDYIDLKLQLNAEEFIMKAQLLLIIESRNNDVFIRARDLYELALRSRRGWKELFAYARFLQDFHRLSEANAILQELNARTKIYKVSNAPEDLLRLALVCGTLGVNYSMQKKMEESGFLFAKDC